MSRNVSSLARVFAVLLLLLVPMASFAQDDSFEFDESEVEPTDDGEEMTFDENEVLDESEDSGTPVVAVVAVPGQYNDSERRSELQAELARVARSLPDIVPVGPEGVLAGLRERGLEECVVEPLCLASAAKEADVDRVLLGRVKQFGEGEGFGLDIDLFDVEDKLFVRYDSTTGHSDTGAIIDAVEGSVKVVFNIREERKSPDYVGEEDTGMLQSILFFGSAGLSVACLAAGVYFGMEASRMEDELAQSPKSAAGVYQMTQKQAETRLLDVESQAVTANVFYGLSVGLAVASVLFQVVETGSDVADPSEFSERSPEWRVLPLFGQNGFGVGALLEF
jgi:hypothetical protein